MAPVTPVAINKGASAGVPRMQATTVTNCSTVAALPIQFAFGSSAFVFRCGRLTSHHATSGSSPSSRIASGTTPHAGSRPLATKLTTTVATNSLSVMPSSTAPVGVAMSSRRAK